MSGDFLATPRSSARWRLLVVVLAVVTAVALGLVLLRPSRGSAPSTGAPGQSATPSSGSASTVVPSIVASTAAPLRLVPGAKTVDGVAVQYPHSTVGAVSAAIEYWAQLGSTLDPDRARKIGARIAVRSWRNAGDDLAQGPVNTRRQLGLPAIGPVPPGASISLGPVAYQLRDAQPDSVTVLVLAYLVTTTPVVGPQSRLGVFPAPLRWDSGDWRLDVDQTGADYRSLQVAPGSPAAAAAGWLEYLQ